MSEPDYPIFEIHTDERGRLTVRISNKFTLLTQDQSEQVLERFKSLEAENSKLRDLCLRMRTYMTGVVEHNSYQIMTTGYTMLGGRIKECDEAMRALGIEVPE